jgi:uncharacterized tellurite resistance protein B-like protein
MQRTYAHKKANRFFTLYFIPLIPLGSAGEYIECSACGGTYGVEVLQYNPAAAQAEAIVDLRRMLSLVLLTAGRTDAVYIEALSRVCEEVFNLVVAEGQIEEDLRLARAAQAQLVPFVQGRAAHLSPQGRELLLKTAAHVLAARGSLTGSDQDVLRQLGGALGVSSAQIESVVSPKRIAGSTSPTPGSGFRGS